MTAEKKRTSDRSSPPPESARGPEAWERVRIRSFLDRLERAEASGVDPNDGLPDPSDREELLRDVLTAAFGPPQPAAVPECVKNDPGALHAWARRRRREAKRERERALLRLARRFPSPIRKKRWRKVKAEVTETLEAAAAAGPPWLDESEHLEDGEDRSLEFLAGFRSPDWKYEEFRRAGVADGWLASLLEERPAREARAMLDAFYGALLGAVAEALDASRVRSANVEKLRDRLETAAGNALEAHLAPEAAEEDLPGYDAVAEGGSSDRNAEDGLARPAPGSAHLEEQVSNYRDLEARYDAGLDFDRLREEASAEERTIIEAVRSSIAEEGLRGGDPNISDAHRRADVDYSESTFRRRWNDLLARVREAV